MSGTTAEITRPHLRRAFDDGRRLTPEEWLAFFEFMGEDGADAFPEFGPALERLRREVEGGVPDPRAFRELAGMYDRLCRGEGGDRDRDGRITFIEKRRAASGEVGRA